MNKPTYTILAAAVSGLLMGCTAEVPPKKGPGPEGATSKPAEKPAAKEIEKHACKSLNSCKNQGGCGTDKSSCRGDNECAKKGGCATVPAHSCGGKNICKGLGGCKTDKNECKGQNDCKEKGGCHVGKN